jgi:ATP-dependent 26S proteasome regulatory subunit
MGTVEVKQSVPNPTKGPRNVPSEHFADLGGVDGAKEQIRQVVQGHFHPERYQRYGLLRNGVLLYGPRGTGKPFLARATAGEFGLNFEYVSAPTLRTRWTGATSENIKSVFAHAAARKPVLFFIDEIDAIGAVRQDATSDSGGAGRELNNITASLISAIDQYRFFSGFILMAATNRLDGLDEALIREGRFDVKIRLDLPDEATRASILEAQLSKKPWRRFDVRDIASQTPGASAARLRALVDQAANYALTENRKIEARDLR